MDNEQSERLELYVLRLLDDGEDASVERWMQVDVQARERVRTLRGVIGRLAFGLERVDPSPQLKGRILVAAHAEAERLH